MVIDQDQPAYFARALRVPSVRLAEVHPASGRMTTIISDNE